MEREFAVVIEINSTSDTILKFTLEVGGIASIIFNHLNSHLI